MKRKTKKKPSELLRIYGKWLEDFGRIVKWHRDGFTVKDKPIHTELGQ